MKKLVICMALILAMGMAFALPKTASAEKLEVTADASVAFASKYVWRGMLLVDDWVAQPSVTVGVAGFSFNFWGDYNLTDQNSRKNKFDEIDLTLSYEFAIDKFSIPVGIIHYTFPNVDGALDTTEVFAGVSYDWIVTPAINVYYDADEAHGFYINGSLGYSYELPSPDKMMTWSVDLAVGIGWASSDYNSFYYGVDESHFTDWNAGLSIPIGIGEYFSITPAVTYTALVDSEIADTTDNDKNTLFVITFGASF